MQRKQKLLIFLGLFVAVDLIAIAVVLLTSQPLTRQTSATTRAETAVAEFTAQIRYDETTEAPETPTQSADAQDMLTLSFAGDCMFASNHGAAANGSFNAMAQYQPPEYFLKNFIPMFTSDDLTIVNCECVLSDAELEEKEVTTEIAFWFKGPASNAQIFRAGGVDVAGVVNNHSHDFGQQGSDDTEAALEAVGVTPGPRNTPVYKTVKGVKIGIYFCSLYSYDYVYDCLDQLGRMQRENCDLTVLFFHGGIENETVPEDWKIRACRALIDAGADIVVGAHPHVLQRMELYGGKPILYSLGNFCFGGNRTPPRDTAVYQAVYHIENGQIGEREDVLIPCSVYSGGTNNYQPYIVTNTARRQAILDRRAGKTDETTTEAKPEIA